MPWKCFLIEPSPYCRLSLRRFTFSKETVGDTSIGFRTVEKSCPRGKDWGHDAFVVIANQVEAQNERSTLKGEFEGDPRWPARCVSCAYVFEERDQWQVNYDQLWKGSPDGKLYVLRESPPGAMWHAHWLEDATPNRYTGPDGKAWCLMMPGGVEWIVYGHSSIGEGKDRKEGPKWQVSGAPPNITAHPSIAIGKRYHGFVKGGVISADCEGRKFPAWPSTA